MTATLYVVDGPHGRAWWIRLPSGEAIGWWRQRTEAEAAARSMGASAVGGGGRRRLGK